VDTMQYTNEAETWKPVHGWEGLYEVSSIGRVRSLVRLIPRKNGSSMRLKGRILRQTPNTGRGNHLSIQMRDKDRVIRREVHVLVCHAFHGPKPTPKHCAAHYDGNPQNNIYCNLRWATQKENMADAIRHGTLSTRQNGKPDAYPTHVYDRVGSLLKSGTKVTDIMIETGISMSTAYRFKRQWQDHW